MSLSHSLAVLLIQGKTTTDNVVAVLTKYRMLSLLPEVLKAVKKLESGAKTHDSIMVESPFPLSGDVLSRIQRIVGNDLAHTEVSIKKSILSGFKARYKGKLYDGSGERIIKQLLANQVTINH